MSDHPVIGHVHLKVSDIAQSVAFYRDNLGFELQQEMDDSAAFMSFGGYHHHLGLNVWHSRGGSRPPSNATGLYHLAILYPTRKALAAALQKLIVNKVRIDGASDHGVSEAIYLHDPDGNGIEIYWDKPKAMWPMVNGKLEMTLDPLDLDDLLAELEPA